MKIEINVKQISTGEYEVTSSSIPTNVKTSLPLCHTCANWELVLAFVEGYCNLMADVKGMLITVDF